MARPAFLLLLLLLSVSFPGIVLAQDNSTAEPGTEPPDTPTPDNPDNPDADADADDVSGDLDDARCGFCPGGYPPLNPTVLLPKTDPNSNFTTTCGDLHDELSVITVPDDCRAAQNGQVLGAGSIDGENEGGEGEGDGSSGGYPSECGYCSVPEDAADSRCTLCPDGSDPTFDPSTVLTEYLEGEPDINGTVATTTTTTTCGDLAYNALTLPSASTQCAQLQGSASAHCGCKPLRCNACPDGSAMPNPDQWSHATDKQCGTLESEALELDPLSLECKFIQIVSLGECGCPFVFPYEPTCPLCGDGKHVPDPTLELFEGQETSSCGLYEWRGAVLYNGEDGTCEAAQATYGVACGCGQDTQSEDEVPEEVEPVRAAAPCNVQCPDADIGSEFQMTRMLSDYKLVAEGVDGGEEEVVVFDDWHLCGEVLFQMSVVDEYCTFDNMDKLAMECCSEGVEVQEVPSAAGRGGRVPYFVGGYVYGVGALVGAYWVGMLL